MYGVVSAQLNSSSNANAFSGRPFPSFCFSPFQSDFTNNVTCTGMAPPSRQEMEVTVVSPVKPRTPDEDRVALKTAMISQLDHVAIEVTPTEAKAPHGQKKVIYLFSEIKRTYQQPCCNSRYMKITIESS